MASKRHLALFLGFFLMITCSSIKAQDQYLHSAGLRLGPLTGISYKRFITTPGTVEGVLGFNFTNGRIAGLTGLYQHHFFINYQLNWFAGGGLTIGANKTNFFLNPEVVVGIEYIVPNYPVNFSFDYKPVFHLFSQDYFLNEFGITIRYVID